MSTEVHSLQLVHLQSKYLPSRWISFPSYQVIHLTEGSGKWFVDSMGMKDIKSGDILFLAPDIEQAILSDKIYFEDNDRSCKWSVLSFQENILPVNYKVMPEFNDIYALLRKSRMGILFSAQPGVVEELDDLLDPFPNKSALEQAISVYQALKILARAEGVTVVPRQDAFSVDNQLPISRTYTYLIRHMGEDIKLPDVADFAGQNVSALCRRFKSVTGQSILSCLQELRLSQAARMLAESEMPVAQIAADCGFSSVNQFNRLFRSRMDISAEEYRKHFQTPRN